MLRVVHINKKRSDKHDHCFYCYVIKSAGDRQESIVISHLKSTVYRNKISFKLEYRAANARKYVRCARTFYSTVYIMRHKIRERFISISSGFEMTHDNPF